MKAQPANIWGEERMTMQRSIELTIESLHLYGSLYKHWAIAFDTILKLPQWAYLAPLKRLKPLYRELVKPQYRLRQVGELKKDGTLSANPMRMGPYTMAARCYGLSVVLAIQNEVNTAAQAQSRPLIDLINDEEHARILTLMVANTWPDGWTGNEIIASRLVDQVYRNGVVQPLMLEEVEA